MLLSRMTTFAACAVWSMASACTSMPGTRIDPPEGFLQLRGDPSGSATQLATTADGGRLVVKEFKDPENGDLDFWADALRHDLVESRGYSLQDETDVVDADLNRGRCMRFAVRSGGRQHGYLIAVFALEKRIRTVEFAADDSVFEAHRDAVRDAIATLR